VRQPVSRFLLRVLEMYSEQLAPQSRSRSRLLCAMICVSIGAVAGLTACSSSQSRPPETEPTAIASRASTASDSVGPTSVTNVGNTFLPDIVGVVARYENSLWTFDVTVSSPYDTAQQYADGWRVVGPDGTVFGEHRLLHDHQSEQPFTRTQSGVSIPADVTLVEIEGRDQRNGYGGKRFVVTLAK
jgi:hypothetical protein